MCDAIVFFYVFLCISFMCFYVRCYCFLLFFVSRDTRSILAEACMGMMQTGSFFHELCHYIVHQGPVASSASFEQTRGFFDCRAFYWNSLLVSGNGLGAPWSFESCLGCSADLGSFGNLWRRSGVLRACTSGPRIVFGTRAGWLIWPFYRFV